MQLNIDRNKSLQVGREGVDRTSSPHLHLLQERLYLRPAEFYDADYFKRAETRRFLQLLKITGNCNAAVVKRCDAIIRALNWRDGLERNLNSPFEQLPTEIHAYIATLLPCYHGNGFWMRCVFAIFRTIYGLREELLNRVVLPAWMESQDVRFIDMPYYSTYDPSFLEMAKYQRALNFSFYNRCDLDKHLFTHFTALKHLNLSRCHGLINQIEFDKVASLKGLETLILDGCTTNQKYFEALSHLQRLKKLSVADCHWVTKRNFHFISHLTNLESLNISRCYGINDANFWGLQTLTALRELKFKSKYNPLTDKSLSILGTLAHLTKLQIAVPPMVTSLSLDSIGNLKHLQKLQLLHVKAVPASNLAFLTLLTQLRSLKLDYCDLSKATSSIVAKLSNLTSFRLANTWDPIKENHFNEFCLLEKLQKLSLKSCKVTTAALNHIKTLHKMRRLELLTCSRITSRVFLHLSLLTNLTNLKVVKCKKLIIDDIDFALFPQLKRLHLQGYMHIADGKVVKQGFSALTNKALGLICQLTSLQKLHFNHFHSYGTELRLLTALCNLQKLCLLNMYPSPSFGEINIASCLPNLEIFKCNSP